jgi:replicative DNA helicase
MIDDIILSQLLRNEHFSKVATPHIQTEYFEADRHQIVHHLISDYSKKYRILPSRNVLLSELENKNLPEKIYQDAVTTIKSISSTDDVYDDEWLLEKTEQFCKDRALSNALLEAVNKSESEDRGEIPEILKKALSISFDNHIGHDYFNDAEERHEFYSRKLNKIAYDLELLNLITQGGVLRKTLNCLLAGTGVGKSMALCHFAASYIAQGYNVLYVTMEMAEEEISKRIDANLFDIDINHIADIGHDDFMRKINSLQSKIHGKLIIKEYPTSTAHVGHIRHLLSELKLKKNFIPDVLIVDYVNIMSSFRHKSNKGMYEYVKSIGEELRGLCVEYNMVGWTATQVNRDGLKSNDFDMTETSESMGLVHALDLFLAIIATEELEKINMLKFKQLKNRYGPISIKPSFLVGVDRPKMRLFNSEEQNKITKIEDPLDETISTNLDNLKSKFAEVFQ